MASDARPTASRNTDSVGIDMPVTWGRVDGRAHVRVPARATPIEGLAGWCWSAGLSASLHDWSSNRGFYNHRVTDQPGRSEWRLPERQMTGPGGGRPRDDDGALAAIGPVGGLGWHSWGGGPTWAELGEAWQGREDSQRTGGWSGPTYAVRCNQVRYQHEPDPPRTRLHTSPHTAPCSRSPLVRGRASNPLVPIRGGLKCRSRCERARLPGPSAHFPSHCTSFLFSLGPGKSEQPPGPDSGGGLKCRSRCERARLRGPSFGLVRFGSVQFGLVWLVLHLLVDPPSTGGADREEPH